MYVPRRHLAVARMRDDLWTTLAVRFDAVASLLTWIDTAALLLYALEYDAPEVTVRLLLYDSAYPLVDQLKGLKEQAATFGCRRALRKLASSDTKRPEYASCASDRLSFPPRVLYAALLSNPTLRHIQWLHTKTSPAYEPAVAMTIAARHRRLDLTQWLADQLELTSHICVLAPFQPKTGRLYMNWIVLRADPESDGAQVDSFFATVTHGLAPVVSAVLYYNAIPALYPAVDHAAMLGDLELVQQLHDDQDNYEWPCTTNAIDMAATQGRLDIVQWLHLHRKEGCTSAAIEGASANGHFMVVKWLYFFCQVQCTGTAFDGALRNGHLSILKWQNLRFPHFRLSDKALEAAVASNHRHVLEWVETTLTKVEVTPGMVQNSISGGHLDMVQWLLSKSPNPTRLVRSNFVLDGAGSGNVALVEWLVEAFDMPVARSVLQAAVDGGHLDMTQWVMLRLPPLDKLLEPMTLFNLAKRSHWGVLVWVLQHQHQLCVSCVFLPTNYRLPRIRRSNDPMWKWFTRYARLILQHSPRLCDPVSAFPLWAAKAGQTDLLRQLLAVDHPHVMTKRVFSAVLRCTMAGDIVHDLLLKRPQWSTRRVIQWSTRFRQWGLLRWLIRQQPPFFSHIVARTAVRHDHIDVLAWLREVVVNDEELYPLVWRTTADVGLICGRPDTSWTNTPDTNL